MGEVGLLGSQSGKHVKKSRILICLADNMACHVTHDFGQACKIQDFFDASRRKVATWRQGRRRMDGKVCSRQYVGLNNAARP